MITDGVCSEASGNAFTNDDIVVMSMSRTGDKGNIGIDGPCGIDGSCGIEGQCGPLGIYGGCGIDGACGLQGNVADIGGDMPLVCGPTHETINPDT